WKSGAARCGRQSSAPARRPRLRPGAGLCPRTAQQRAPCGDKGLRLAGDEVYVLAHWTADRIVPRRFSTYFLVARMPEGQEPVADEAEQFEPEWVLPADALLRQAAGAFSMMFPTIRTLEHLRGYATVDDVLRACTGEAPLWRSCPRTGLLGGRETRLMEHEPAFGELALVCPDGQVLHALDWKPSTPVHLLRNLIRLTAPNPGVMTGPGTNSYLVGDVATGYIAIDPGPADADHLAALHAAAGGDIRMIVCTHSHPDHSPGARPLQALCAGTPPILGLSSATTARADSQFSPERELVHGEQLHLAGMGTDGPLTHTLKILHTPGHAANHICLVLVEDGLLFSGDHVLNGSTTVVNPPDGAMTAYLESLDLLAAACTEHDIGFILPAHGYVLGNAAGAIAQLKAHRLKREAKVLAAMQARPGGTLDDWLPLAYDDVDVRVLPVARRSLQAHVERIQASLDGHAGLH
ncbi:MAG: MBL fold metallo-hydrolase, partial [Haliea sp.]